MSATGRPLVLVVRIAFGHRCGDDPRQQAALDLDVFGNGFDDPIAIPQLHQVIVEIADLDTAANSGEAKAAGLDFFSPSRAFAASLLGLPGCAMSSSTTGSRRWLCARRCGSPSCPRPVRRCGGLDKPPLAKQWRQRIPRPMKHAWKASLPKKANPTPYPIRGLLAV